MTLRRIQLACLATALAVSAVSVAIFETLSTGHPMWHMGTFAIAAGWLIGILPYAYTEQPKQPKPSSQPSHIGQHQRHTTKPRMPVFTRASTYGIRSTA